MEEYTLLEINVQIKRWFSELDRRSEPDKDWHKGIGYLTFEINMVNLSFSSDWNIKEILVLLAEEGVKALSHWS